MKYFGDTYKKAGIRAKLLVVFIIVISILVVFLASLAITYSYAINQHREMMDKLVLEHRISMLVPELILDYYDLAKNVKDEEKLKEYNDTKKSIGVLFLQLDELVTSQESRVVYKGLKNIVNGIIENSDKGIEDVRRGDLSTYDDYYEDSSKKQIYVDQNTANLVSKEVENAEMMQSTIQHTHRRIILSAVILLAVIIAGCILLAFIFLKRITTPIIRLSSLAENIAKGDLELNVGQELMNAEGEIGSLSNSFNGMLGQLKKEINSQKQVNSDLSKIKRELEQKNEDLERFNKVAVDRELKMIELKNKIKELENK